MSNYENNDVLCYLHLMYNNRPAEIFSEIWSDNPCLAEHLAGKYQGMADAYGSVGAPAPFFCALSVEYQRQLTDYARAHYATL